MEKGLHLKKHTQKSQLLVGSETSYLLQAADVRLDSVLLVEVDLLSNTCFYLRIHAPAGIIQMRELGGIRIVSFTKIFSSRYVKRGFLSQKIQCCTTPKTYLDKKKEGKYEKNPSQKGGIN